MRDKEANAYNLRREFDTRPSRRNATNYCAARACWNACDYIDHHLEEHDEHGKLCWNQYKRHNCCHCMEVSK